MPERIDRSPAVPTHEDRLDSWKEIAAYLKRDMRTVQRWEKLERLPVHRLQHTQRGSVFAYRTELDAWRETRAATSIPEPPPATPVETPVAAPPASRSRLVLALGCIATLLAVGIAAQFAFRTPPKVSTFTGYPVDQDMPALSPDGAEVAFRWRTGSTEKGDIYVRRIGSPEVRRLTTSPEEDYSPAWSPDGRTIAFLRAVGNQNQLVLVPASGGPERILQTFDHIGELNSSTLAWTPDGRFVAAPASVASSGVSLHLVSLEDGTLRPLTLTPPGQLDLQPAFSPDGRRLAFMRVISQSVYSIYVQPLTPDFLPAGNARALALQENARVQSPAWVGKDQLLFTAWPKEGSGIWRVRIGDDGRVVDAPRRESYAPRGVEYISVARPSPATHRLVFTQESHESNVWSLDLRRQPGALRRIVSGGHLNAHAAYSPDGKRIAFESDRSGAPEIWIANSDGTSPRQMTFFNGPVTGSPAWSPDGKWIAFDSRAEGYPHIYVLPSAGGQPRRLTVALASNVVPSWSVDGKSIYYAGEQTGTYETWRVGVDGSAPQRITYHGGGAAAQSPDGQFLYYQQRTDTGFALHRLRLSDGDDRVITGDLLSRAFTPAPGGVYYVAVPRAGESWSVRIARDDGTVRIVAQIGRANSRALSLSPDGATLLYTQIDQFGRHLMLVEDFQ